MSPTETPAGEAYTLRPATDDDIPRLAEIENQVHIAPWTEENFRTELLKPYSNVLVLTDDETDSKIAGYIVFWKMFEEFHILNVAVALPFRGLGYGKKMVRAVTNFAQKAEARRILLDVRKSNQAAIQLYQSVGFVITHVNKGFYSNGDDAYQMALFLENQNPVNF